MKFGRTIGWIWAALAACALAARAETARVADCVRDAAIDFWAAADVQFCRNVMDEVFARAGVEPERAEFGADGVVSPSDAEVICSAFRTPKLLEDYDFPLQPLGRMHYGLYATPKRASEMKSMPLADWPQMKVAYSPVSQGQESNTDRVDYFEWANLKPEYVEYRTSAGAVEALRKGEVDALFLYTPHGKRPEGLVEVVPLGGRNVYFAVRKDRPELLSRLSAAYREWYIDEVGQYDAWREELLGIPKPKNRVRIAAFTRGELFTVTPDGKRSGSLEDWIRALCAAARWEPDYVYGTFDQSLSDIADGRLDLMGGLPFSTERNAQMLFSHTACGMLRIYLWTRRTSPYKAGRPESWRGMKLGVMAGTNSGRRVREQVEKGDYGIELHEYALEREMLDDYAAGKIDACVNVEMQELAKERALRLYAAYQTYFVCTRGKPALFEKLEEALGEICEDYPKYLRLISERHYGSHSEMSELSIAEAEWLSKWLKDPAPIVIDFSPWPFKVADEKGRPAGFPKALMNEMTRRTGLQFKTAPQTDIQTAEARFLRGDTAFWVPYPGEADEMRHGAVTAFSVPVPQRCAEAFGVTDFRREFSLLVRPEVDEELVSILRKTIAGISSEQLLEMFMEAVAERKFFGLSEDQLKEYGALVGLGFFVLVTAYGGVMLLLLRRQAQMSETAAFRAEESAQAKTRFLAMMSHELRTPLNAVIGFAEFMAREDLPHERREEFIQGIITSATALLDLINDILDLSKLETGAMRMRVGGCSVERLMDELPAIFGYRAEHNGVTLTVKRTSEAEVPDVVLSQQGFRQVLLNLVGNATKFTKDGTIEVEYGWEQETAETGTLRITVRDTGCGISGDKMERLFDPFVQDISSRMEKAESKTKGTGLGLPIVKRLVDSAGGNISVKSELGQGTEIRIVLPALCIAEKSEEAAEEPAGSGKDDTAKGKTPRSVLVVDDMTINQRVLGIHLQNLGVEDVRIAANGVQALEAMRDWTPDVVLTDMWMPEMDGQKLAEAMAADKRLSKIPLVVITADVEVESTHNGKLFAKVLAKPVTNGKLRQLFKEL